MHKTLFVRGVSTGCEKISAAVLHGIDNRKKREYTELSILIFNKERKNDHG